MKSLFSIFNEKKNESSAMRGAAAAMTVESANAVLTEIFGADSRAFVEAVYLKNNVLGIKTSGSGAALEIRMREGDIIAKINEKFGGPAVNKIKFLS
jgi:predicted nucleic acid-binding Zn ribbon protein